MADTPSSLMSSASPAARTPGRTPAHGEAVPGQPKAMIYTCGGGT